MTRFFWRPSLAHLVAMAGALWFAWHVSQSGFAKTSVQFIAPLLIIMTVHVVWLWGAERLRRGFAQAVYRRSIVTSFLMAGLLLGGSLFAPQPAQAQASDAAAMILTVVFCVFIIAVIVGIAGGIVYLAAKLIFAVVDKARAKDEPKDPDETLNDVASLAIAVVFLIGTSMEGVTPYLNFETRNAQSASHLIEADAETVWAVMQTATSPEFPLPNILASFPQPVAVTTDEGTDLGARRTVAFHGREGAGALRLEVVARTDNVAMFAVLSDTTPYASWIGYERLTYEVHPVGEKTFLTVTLAYERRLSPAWFFEPVMAGAATLAMDVLARDVKARAEQGG